MANKPQRPRTTRASTPSFKPVTTRVRHDGWSPEKQAMFIDALAQSGCVHEACATVGRSRQSAYALRVRIDAHGFRMAWDAAIDLSMRRLSDECASRALNGVAVPHFYKGEQVGEHRRYDDRLAMFLLRYRDPLRYARTLDEMVYSGHEGIAALAFAKARERMIDEAHGVSDEPPTPMPPYTKEVKQRAAQAQVAEMREAERRRVAAEEQAKTERKWTPEERENAEWLMGKDGVAEYERVLAEGLPGGDVATILSTSGLGKNIDVARDMGRQTLAERRIAADRARARGFG